MTEIVTVAKRLTISTFFPGPRKFALKTRPKALQKRTVQGVKDFQIKKSTSKYSDHMVKLELCLKTRHSS